MSDRALCRYTCAVLQTRSHREYAKNKSVDERMLTSSFHGHSIYCISSFFLFFSFVFLADRRCRRSISQLKGLNSTSPEYKFKQTRSRLTKIVQIGSRCSYNLCIYLLRQQMQDTNSRATPCDPWTLMKNATSFTKKYVYKYFGFQGG